MQLSNMHKSVSTFLTWIHHCHWQFVQAYIYFILFFFFFCLDFAQQDNYRIQKYYLSMCHSQMNRNFIIFFCWYLIKMKSISLFSLPFLLLLFLAHHSFFPCFTLWISDDICLIFKMRTINLNCIHFPTISFVLVFALTR